FSSRRRHTRSDRDWSSDVCSSDLGLDLQRSERTTRILLYCLNGAPADRRPVALLVPANRKVVDEVDMARQFEARDPVREMVVDKIGRASCRERGYARMRSGSGKRK